MCSGRERLDSSREKRKFWGKLTLKSGIQLKRRASAQGEARKG